MAKVSCETHQNILSKNFGNFMHSFYHKLTMVICLSIFCFHGGCADILDFI